MFDPRDENPLVLLQSWMKEAEAAEVNDPNAVSLASVSDEGWPSVRIVLVKGHDESGVHFYTNYSSRKAEELDVTGRAAMCFHWKSLRRQVRLVGAVSRLDANTSDAYYATRPYGSQIGAWASDQSAALDERATLEERVARFSAKYRENPPRPPHWGGYRLTPHEMEFWMNAESRLHDRFHFTLENGVWSAVRLYP